MLGKTIYSLFFVKHLEPKKLIILSQKTTNLGTYLNIQGVHIAPFSCKLNVIYIIQISF